MLLTAKQALTLDAIDCLMPHASNLEMTVVRPQRRSLTYAEGHHMIIRDPETNFEQLWKTFHRRYPFFALRNVDWTSAV